ncbi:competence protein CoiA [Virgibacillus doumboii]|uniref:competence protein CoiA n=1 Tax=Virgibacillus doumboii TaxID=2697503 RepID=UPI0013DFAB0E|nr:competence protein CoiA family protein [Virgibacillus doumboii]
MLQAKTKYGNLVTLASLTRVEITKLKRQETFLCPTCNEEVIAKAGSQMIPHFAHRSKSNCPSQEGGEGSYHEKGKMLLFQWLKHQNLDVQLEAYLPEIKQRPDILVRLKHKAVAIEYQCARVPPEQIRKRNEGYHKAGIVPIWILGANRMERRGRDCLNIDQFHLYFIHQFSSAIPLTLFYFCPETLQFISFQDFYISTKQKAIGKLHVKKLPQMIFTDLFQAQFFSKNELYHVWKREKRVFRLKPAAHVYGRDLAWYQWLYLEGTHKEHLPSIIHLPVSTQFKMKSPPWDWQSRICLKIIAPLPVGGRFSLKSCEHLLRTHLRYSNHFLLIKPVTNPILQYLQLLERLTVIRQFAPNQFIKVNQVLFYKSIEAALPGDDKQMNLLRTNKIRA